MGQAQGDDQNGIGYDLILGAARASTLHQGSTLPCRAYPIVEPTVRALRIRRGCGLRSHQEVHR
ncbi:hypothetical protein BOSE62_30554 [Bosea sp. 62]|nr:hypothetical protein BOSE46_130023 [Bosea sp. 46]CAD5265682.1 hypothetical protein BOSE21B_111053 [Bosea sp. 21B]CAD5274114.1 hypothetical protein BOSE7B_40099 [Bosea sp. 7B]VVT56723.1 hypothetical protein BOS5A_170098 [Bosea sp. EC-HK365B]VXB76526.1 hypothetical protein BOSE29B_120181 [Bosea sp. 29B]VXC14790.1 hypothetical protein BOSE125_180033 [Bosea sp. 125]VXC25694.1 hypothetical protein BOSE62_30554 [Bosea sp. 62]VXC73923.1 hypothetical protein BOSE127_40339 [Bosea sp. 127]